jgi:hypothetical protein
MVIIPVQEGGVMRRITHLRVSNKAYCSLKNGYLQSQVSKGKGLSGMAKSKIYSSKRGKAQPRHGLSPLLIILAGAVILIVTLILALQTSPSNPTTPEVTGTARLKSDKQKIDLGDVKLGTLVKTSFQLTNIGDQVLRFTKAPYVEIKEGC